ncbi:MAG: AraC family transcriptional regulator [Saprospiraceae bacterium]
MAAQNIPTHSLPDLSPLDFKIELINHVSRYNPLQVHRHDYFEIFVFEEASGSHLIDFEELPIRSRQIHFVTPGQVHQIRRSPASQGLVMLFSEAFYHFNRERSDFLFQLPFFYNKTGSPVIELPPDEFADCSQIIGNMLSVFSSKSSQKKSMLQSYLNIFLCHCLDCFERQLPASPPKSAGLALFQQFQTALEKNFRSGHEVADYAKQLAVSPRQLNDFSKKFAGISAVELIHRRLALEAKRLLFYTEANVSEIGFELGFEDPAHFSRFVRKCTGRAPSEWRKKEGV